MRSRLHALDVTPARRTRPGLRAFAPAAAALLAAFALSACTPGAALAQKPRIPAAPPADAAAAPVSAEAVRVVFGGVTLSGAENAPERRPYRDPADNELCIAPESLAALGVTHIVDEQAGKAAFLLAETGRSATVALRTPADGSGRTGVFVPAVETLEALGGKCQFDAKAGVLHVRAVLTDVEILGGQLRIRATLPVIPKITGTNNNRLLIFDIPAAEVGALPKNLTLPDPNVEKARSGQFSEDVARVVLETKAPARFGLLNPDKPATLLVMNPLPVNRPETIVVSNKPEQQPIEQTTAAAQPAPRASSAKTPPPTRVRAVAFERVSDTQARIILRAGSAPTAVPSQTEGRLVFSLPNVTLASGAGDGLERAEHPLLKGIELIARSATQAQLALNLTRAVTFSVRMEPGRGLVIDLGLPRGSGGRVAGKTIIVDAGHGGNDRGARGVNGTYEKAVNFAVARKLAEELRAMDANVIMTRDTDEFVPLGERSFIANRAGADFFISIHADSAGAAARGSTVYYHANLPSARTLAQCIADRLAQMGTIPSRGARSDYKLYPGDGLSVLRRSQMVAVLVECGYMSNSADVRQLVEPSVQDKIARLIAEGLRDYVEGNPDVDTRFLNPRGRGEDGGVRVAASLVTEAVAETAAGTAVIVPPLVAPQVP